MVCHLVAHPMPRRHGRAVRARTVGDHGAALRAGTVASLAASGPAGPARPSRADRHGKPVCDHLRGW